MQGAKSKIQNTIPSTLFRQAALEGVATNKILYWRKRKKTSTTIKNKFISDSFFFSPYIKRIVQRPAVGTLNQKKNTNLQFHQTDHSVHPFRFFDYFHSIQLLWITLFRPFHARLNVKQIPNISLRTLCTFAIRRYIFFCSILYCVLFYSQYII